MHLRTKRVLPAAKEEKMCSAARRFRAMFVRNFGNFFHYYFGSCGTLGHGVFRLLSPLSTSTPASATQSYSLHLLNRVNLINFLGIAQKVHHKCVPFANFRFATDINQTFARIERFAHYVHISVFLVLKCAGNVRGGACILIENLLRAPAVCVACVRL